MSSSVCHFTSVQYSMPASHNSYLSSILYKKVQSHYFHHPTNTNNQAELLLVFVLRSINSTIFFPFFSFDSTPVSSQLEAHDRTSTHFPFFLSHKKYLQCHRCRFLWESGVLLLSVRYTKWKGRKCTCFLYSML